MNNRPAPIIITAADGIAKLAARQDFLNAISSYIEMFATGEIRSIKFAAVWSDGDPGSAQWVESEADRKLIRSELIDHDPWN